MKDHGLQFEDRPDGYGSSEGDAVKREETDFTAAKHARISESQLREQKAEKGVVFLVRCHLDDE